MSTTPISNGPDDSLELVTDLTGHRTNIAKKVMAVLTLLGTVAGTGWYARHEIDAQAKAAAAEVEQRQAANLARHELRPHNGTESHGKDIDRIEATLLRHEGKLDELLSRLPKAE